MNKKKSPFYWELWLKEYFYNKSGYHSLFLGPKISFNTAMKIMFVFQKLKIKR